MGAKYQDRWISCTDDGLTVRGYYFPWGGSKHIPYAKIRTVHRVRLGALTGRARIWGSANPRHWASLDPSRPRKNSGLILDLGGPVKPLITPDDTGAVLDCIRAQTAGAAVVEDRGRAPII